MADEPEAEPDPYEEFEQALNAAREAGRKLSGKPDDKSEFKADTLSAANKLTRLIFTQRRRALTAKK